MKNINDLDALITSGMLMSERKVKTRLNHCPWSPTLEATILQVNLWKIIISDIENDVSKKTQIQRVMTKLNVKTPVDQKTSKSLQRMFNRLRRL